MFFPSSLSLALQLLQSCNVIPANWQSQCVSSAASSISRDWPLVAHDVHYIKWVYYKEGHLYFFWRYWKSYCEDFWTSRYTLILPKPTSEFYLTSLCLREDLVWLRAFFSEEKYSRWGRFCGLEQFEGSGEGLSDHIQRILFWCK